MFCCYCGPAEWQAGGSWKREGGLWACVLVGSSPCFQGTGSLRFPEAPNPTSSSPSVSTGC